MSINKQKYVYTGLILVVVFQILVLGMEYFGAVYPLWIGKEIKLRTLPVDPRSLFRGNYARLRYDISEIPAAHLPHPIKPDARLRNGEKVYVSLKLQGGVYVYKKASLTPPESGVFLKGRVSDRSRHTKGNAYTIRYGIEAFFAPKEKAIEYEKKLRHNAIAIVMLTGDGKSTLKNIKELILQKNK